MKHFKFYSKKDILSLTKTRRFETRIGERIQCCKTEGEWPQVIAESTAKYVLIGVPEDIGTRANNGASGADTNWLPFLNEFLNVQSNDLLTGEDVLLLGHFDFGDIKYLIENNAYNADELLDAYRRAVELIDGEVEQIMKVLAAANKIPIVIGGGHNNAYPLLKGVAKGLFKAGSIPLAQLNCINLSAQSGYKTMEGRHSGNAFRYAETDGYLGKYSIIGLHENLLVQNVVNDMNDNPFIQFSTYEDIFIHERKNFIQTVSHATGFTEDTLTGIEIDLGCVAQVLSTEHTPAGISILQARQYLNFTATDAKVAYLHIAEGACQIADGQKDDNTGKLISYLITDFLKASARNAKL